MSLLRILTITRRVMKQVLRDHRTVALLIVAPILVLSLGSVLFRAEPAAIPLGVVNQDQGVTHPLMGAIDLGQLIVDELSDSDTLEVIVLRLDEVDDRMRDGSVQGVVVLPEDFTSGFLAEHQAEIDLRLEGSNPTRSMALTAKVTQAGMQSLAGLAGSGFGLPQAGEGDGSLPVSVEPTYFYGSEEFDTMDFVAPVYIAVLAMFLVFLLSCVAFLRERSQGTMERLAATPATRGEIVVGYMFGLGLFALFQVAVILFYTVWVLKIHYFGSLPLMFLVIAMLALMGVTMGILASAFARNEFQVVQFIPVVIIPQILLGGTFWAVADLPAYLRPLAYAMPIYYANTALRDVMLKGWGLQEIWPNLAVLAGITAVLGFLSTLMMRREVA